ncbi:hypothetical protein [Halococcus qingdaonensis]|uniref:hypothetical protein n=1 Tax=Halococcus qingdaonensis TaxID=224402 RepID=UPI002116FC25|nr:hypothetical protein [Halococcus qingdaonensis]
MVAAEMVFLGATVFQIAFTLPVLLDSGSTVPRETSVPTALVWFVYAATYVTISYPLAAIASALGGALWLVVAFYRGRPPGQHPNYDVDSSLAD